MDLQGLLQKNIEENNLGLQTYPLITGAGKSRVVLDVIANCLISDSLPDKKFVFATPRKNNLPFEDLKRILTDAGHADLFDKNVLLIDSSCDSALNNYQIGLFNNANEDFINSDEAKAFIADVEHLKNSQAMRDNHAIQVVREKFASETEPKFRRLIRHYLKLRFSDLEKALDAISNDPAWQWVGKLYPAVFSSQKRVFFMSAKKFTSVNSTLVENDYFFIDSDFLENSVVIFDEFDSIKDEFLDVIVEDAAKKLFDVYSTFSTITNVLGNKVFPEYLFVPSNSRLNSKYASQNLKELMDSLYQQAKKIDEKFKTHLFLKSEISESISKSFIFNDGIDIHVSDENWNKQFFVIPDSEAKYNTITLEGRVESANSLHELLRETEFFINRFSFVVFVLALNNMQKKFESRSITSNRVQEESVYSVLALFGLPKSTKDYFVKRIMKSSAEYRYGISDSVINQSFYERGFRYYSIVDDSENEFQSEISRCGILNTPESMLVNLCRRCLVIGLSATADIPGVIKNFDMRYVKAALGELFHTFTNEEKAVISAHHENLTSGYKNVNINVEFISDDKIDWSELFSDTYDAEEIHNLIGRVSGGNQYIEKRYFRIASVYKKVALNPEIMSFLCLLNILPKECKNSLDVSILSEIFGLIDPTMSMSFEVIASDGFEAKKQSVLERLSSGERIFLISTYQTLGTGQNLNYVIPEAIKDKLIQVNNRQGSTKDFDGIYCDCPTNVIANLYGNEDIDLKTLLSAVYYFEGLQEAGEFSRIECEKAVMHAFKKFRHSIAASSGIRKYINIYSVCMAIVKILIQAIGRLCRTSFKNSNIYIFAEERLRGYLDPGLSDVLHLNPEFKALLDAAGNSSLSNSNNMNLSSLAESRSERMIHSLLKEISNGGGQENWNRLREAVLRNPCGDDIPDKVIEYNCYATLPGKANKLFYSFEGDMRKVKLSFERAAGFNSEVSEEASRLPSLMNISPLKSWFNEQGYATRWISGNRIMVPIVFNNIYKGALGEKAGWFWFHKVLNIDLDSITDPGCFELFDFKVPGTGIYVDFKNWSRNYDQDFETQVTKIIEKGNTCGAQTVIIAGTIGGDDAKVQKFEREGIKFLIVPSLYTSDSKNWICEDALEAIREVLL